jgi:hypothetical protein
VLHPGEEAVGTLSWSQDFLSDDAAFAGPGSYDVALELEASGDDEDENAVGVGPIRTSAARLTRIEPRGEDSEVWHRLLEASDSKWPSNGLLKKTLADEVIAKHKNSGYCPYALVLGRYPWMTPLADLRDAADRFHDSPAYPHLLVTVAIAAGSEAGRARNRDASLDEVEGYLKLAKFYDEEALRTGIPAVHAHAAQLKRVDDDELERIREQRRRIK